MCVNYSSPRIPFSTLLRLNQASDKTLFRLIHSLELHFRKECQLIKWKGEEGITFSSFYFSFFPPPFLFFFSVGEVIMAVFPLELCHHSRSNSLSFTHYFHSSIYPSSSFTRNTFTHSSPFSLSICVFLSPSNSLNREKERDFADASRTLFILFPPILFGSSLFYALCPFICPYPLVFFFSFFLTCFNPNSLSLSLPFCSCSLC